ncbi:MAG: hypothetical protein U0324_31515 [Polyangiales bacterium]
MPNHPQHDPNRPMFFFYRETRIEAPVPKMTGAELKTLISLHVANFDPGQALVLEGHGQEEDRIVNDDDSVPLTVGKGETPKRFYSKPPATFGGGL